MRVLDTRDCLETGGLIADLGLEVADVEVVPLGRPRGLDWPEGRGGLNGFGGMILGGWAIERDIKLIVSLLMYCIRYMMCGGRCECGDNCSSNVNPNSFH